MTNPTPVSALLREQPLGQLLGIPDRPGAPSTTRTPECGACNGTGWEYTGPRQVKLCVCAVARSRAAALGERFAGARFDGLEADVTANGRVPHPTLLVARDRMAANPRGSYYLHGDFGAWKTYLAAAQWNVLFDLGMAVVFVSDVELYRALRAVELEGGSPLDFAGAEHLIIDDLGKKTVSPFVRTAYFDVVELVFRTAGRVGLTITSNFPTERLAYDDGREIYDPGMVRRIDQVCEPLALQISPRRKEA